MKAKVVRLRTDITQTANQDQPIAVDIVLTGNKDLVKKLMTLTASDWFDKRAQYARDYPNPKDLVIYHHEWVPAQSIPCFSIKLDPAPRATILFANYFSKGEHRALLVKGKSASIHLEDEDFEVVSNVDRTRTPCPIETP